jgi:urea transporter
MSFGLYLLGYIVVIIGAAYLMHLAHVPQHWVIGIVVVMIGAAVVTGVQSTRTRDKS